VLIALSKGDQPMSADDLTRACNQLGRREGRRSVKTALARLRSSVPTRSAAVLMPSENGLHRLTVAGAEAVEAMPERVRQSLPPTCREALG
jgi:hypothetical protein